MTEARSVRPRGSAALDIEALQDLLASSFEVSVGKPRVVRRRALDTFDRRLERAGRRLQLVAEAGEERLELVQSEETLVSVLDGTGLRWPAMAGALPDGTLKDRVARVAGIRALLVVDECRRLVRRVELRNADRKIVVRLDVDEPAEGAVAPPPVVTVRPLRGYQKEADRAWRLVTTLLEPAPAEPVAPRPVSPSVADPESPARVLLAAELTEFLQEVRDNLPGTIADVDTEFLHDVRVAVRRTRSLVKLGRSAFPAHVREVWEPQFKWLGDLTTPVRDLDVYQLGLPEMAGWLVAASAADLDPFQAYLARRRAAARRTLLRALRGARLRRLLDDWAGELSALADSARSEDGAAWSAGVLARAGVARAHRRVVRGGTSISDSSPPEDLHVLRKRCKELRYALEMFAPVLDGAQVGKAIKDLKSLQDVLGRFQDSEVQRMHAARVRAGDGRGRRPGRSPPRHGRAHGSPLCRAAARPRRVRHRLRVLRPAGQPPADGAPAGQHREGGRVKVYATYNIKGGVGKTSTAVNLAYLAAASGRRVLLWDLDPQGAATYLFRVKPRVKGGGRGLVSGKRPVEDAVKATDFDNLDLLPADFSYRNMDLELDDAKKRTGRLDQLLSGVADDYDIAFLDCPPSVSLVSENVLRAADVLLVPLIPATLSLRTYAQLTRFVADAPRPRPEVVAFFSMADRRKRLHREVIDAIPRDRGRIADTVVPSMALIEQMAERRAPVPAFAPTSRAAKCYEQLWAEVDDGS